MAFAWFFRPVACLALCFQLLANRGFSFAFLFFLFRRSTHARAVFGHGCKCRAGRCFSLARRLRERFPPSYLPPGNSSTRPPLCLLAVGISLYYDGIARKKRKQPPPDRIAGHAPHRGGVLFQGSFARRNGIRASAAPQLILFVKPKSTSSHSHIPSKHNAKPKAHHTQEAKSLSAINSPCAVIVSIPCSFFGSGVFSCARACA